MEAFRMLEMAHGYLVPQAVYVAAKLGLADQLAAGPQSSATLAHATRTHAPSLHRVLRALATVGVLREDDAGSFALTSLGATLRSDTPGSVRAAVCLAGDPMATRSCADMLESVRTGTPAFDRVYGMPVMDYLGDHPEAAATFNDGMAEISSLENAAIAAAYDFGTHTRVVDVGGGRGGLVAEILRAYPATRAVLYDLPAAVRDSSALQAAGVASRCEITAGDFFAAVPGDGDVYVLKRILHDWDDERCITLLRHCRRSVRPGGRVLAIDAVVPADGTPHLAKLVDLFIMIIATGRERTAAEFAALFTAAGLELTRTVPTASMLTILEAVPA